MNLKEFQQQYYERHPLMADIAKWTTSDKQTLNIIGVSGSSLSCIVAQMASLLTETHILVTNDEDHAAYIYNDLRQMLNDEQVYFFPSSYKKALRLSRLDSSNEILRTEVLNRLSAKTAPIVIITYPEALLPKVVSEEGISANRLAIKSGQQLSIDTLAERLFEMNFQRVDFVHEPGQFSVRGGILDIFSYTYEQPFRIDFFGDEVESIRVFDIETQLSIEPKKGIEILPDLHQYTKTIKRISFLEFVNKKSCFHFTDLKFVAERLDALAEEQSLKDGSRTIDAGNNAYVSGKMLQEQVARLRIVEWGTKTYRIADKTVQFQTSPQPVFNKNFDLIATDLTEKMAEGYTINIFSDSVKQTDRIEAIFNDRGDAIRFQAVKNTVHEGFIDHQMRMVCYTDHQIFDRYHKYQLKTDKTQRGKVIMTLKELNRLQVGDYVVHVDHGVGKFGGLVRTDVNGKMQEMVKLIYKNDDIIFVSIHSLHRISKYKGKEGEKPRIHKLGSGTWERLKKRTKSRVKDIARELIKLYALRNEETGFRYSADSYLQKELEASFLYEDTPDQTKATADVKQDMESDTPMDRLVCGDVGFGKTEVAIRAAFKAVTDNKQVAVLVPTTVLAMQHYNTFRERLKDYPCTISYLSRAKSTQKTKDTIDKLAKGKIDIIIGTHKLVGKTVKFKDLGLLIIDEEQKFGVSVKEKLKQLKVNVDTLTLTATPIPRTLQFSLMGARDLSIINTPPPNRYPIQTELHTFDDEVIREAIQIEMNRNGQVFFINNRIQNIHLIKAMITRLVPGCRVVVGHGQMKADELEEVITDFIDYEYDVLVATTIVESGIDIPNVNTIIINNANRFGLSDLHQLRGRVGRSNRKAYCYLLSPELSLLTPDARQRLRAIETFAELGSGFNIAMQDLDIRGAGNMLGAEQSGFIADLGYETYQRILNEAVHELKEEEFSDLYKEKTTEQKNYVTDCQIDTDMELMFSTEYIESVSERIHLYRELDNMKDETELDTFKANMEDRFGEIPTQAEGLMLMVRLRWLAMRYGVEKLTLKNTRMTTYLVSNINSYYYQSNEFGKLLQYATRHPKKCQFKEQNGKRSIVFHEVRRVEDAWMILSTLD